MSKSASVMLNEWKPIESVDVEARSKKEEREQGKSLPAMYCYVARTRGSRNL